MSPAFLGSKSLARSARVCHPPVGISKGNTESLNNSVNVPSRVVILVRPGLRYPDHWEDAPTHQHPLSSYRALSRRVTLRCFVHASQILNDLDQLFCDSSSVVTSLSMFGNLAEGLCQGRITHDLARLRSTATILCTWVFLEHFGEGNPPLPTQWQVSGFVPCSTFHCQTSQLHQPSQLLLQER
ncbi:hypothetical protein KCU65_g12, partial [Aureobasidium melanogenum]